MVVDSGATASLSVTVTIVTGTYATAASFQTELQKDINTAITGQRRLHRRGHRQRA